MKIIIQSGISSVRTLFPFLHRAPHASIPRSSSRILLLALDRVTLQITIYSTGVGRISRRFAMQWIIRRNLQYMPFLMYLRYVNIYTRHIAILVSTKNSAVESFSESSEISIERKRSFLFRSSL